LFFRSQLTFQRNVHTTGRPFIAKGEVNLDKERRWCVMLRLDEAGEHRGF